MSSRSRLLTAVLMLASALASEAGCVSVSYQARRAPLGDPVSPALRIAGVTTGERHTVAGEDEMSGGGWARPTVTQSGLENRNRSDVDSFERTLLWAVRAQDDRGTEVVDMTWSPPSAPRCAGGHPALDILLDLDAPPNHVLAPDAQVHWERPIVIRGARVLTGRFDEDRSLLGQASVIDVRVIRHDGQVAREDCVRVPAAGPDVAYWNTKRWSVGGRFAIRRGLAFSHSSVPTWSVSIGRWVGPIRIGIEGTVGGTNSPQVDGPTGTGLCFITPGPDCDKIGMGGGAIEASGIARRWSHWAIGWSLSFEALVASVHHTPPAGAATINRWASSGGPRLGLQLLRVAPDVLGASRFGPTSAWGVEIFGAAAQEWTGVAAGSPVTAGISLLGF
ncbi:MAG: hypothetical protein QOI66_4673 [Myxococcales bacterium]|nr:hypothetical protein [Myxococcales bacterium]